MKKFGIIFIFIVIFAVGVMLIRREDTNRQIISWDSTSTTAGTYLFTIEEADDEVYSPVIDQYLKTGKWLRVYLIDSELANRTEQNSLLKLIDNSNQIYQNDMDSANPWLISVGQMDDDDAIEIFVGAFRATTYYAAETRPYFLEFRSGVIYRQWTGSRLNDQAFKQAEIVSSELSEFDVLKVIGVTKVGDKLVERIRYYQLEGFSPYEIKQRGQE